MEEIIKQLSECEDIQLSEFRANRERINGMQEGYQLAMSKARNIIRDCMKEKK